MMTRVKVIGAILLVTVVLAGALIYAGAHGIWSRDPTDDEKALLFQVSHDRVHEGAMGLLLQSERGGKGRRNPLGFAHALEGHGPDPVRILGQKIVSDLQGEARLTASPGTREGHEAILAECLGDVLSFALSPDEARQRE